MANTSPVQFKRSSVPGKIPAANTISVGELALNLTDKIIYSKDVTGNVISFTDPTTSLIASLAYSKANSAYNFASNNYILIADLFDRSNNQSNLISIVYNTANSAYAIANNVAPQIEPAFNRANLALSVAQSAFNQANTSYNFANNLSNTVSVVWDTSNSAFSQANLALSVAQSSYDFANNLSNTINVVYNTTNSAFNQANSGYNFANNLSNVVSIVWNQANNTSNIASAAYDNSNTKFGSSGGNISGPVTINSSLLVTGNVTFTGNVTTVSANNLAIKDNMIYLNEDLSGNINPDLGVVGAYNDGIYHHTGIFRDATDGVWKVFDNYEPEPDASVWIDTSNSTFRIADFQANTVQFGQIKTSSDILVANLNSDLLDGQHGSYYTNLSNTALELANTKFSSNGGTITGNVVVTGFVTANSYIFSNASITSKKVILSSSGNNQLIDFFGIYDYSSCKYLIESRYGLEEFITQTGNTIITQTGEAIKNPKITELSEILLIQDETSSYIVETGYIKNNQTICEFYSDINNGIVRLFANTFLSNCIITLTKTNILF